MKRVVQRLEILVCPEASDPRRKDGLFIFFTVGSV